MPTHVLLVGNPTAQTGRAAARIDAALAAMQDRGWGARLLPTEPEGRTVAAVARAVDEGPWEIVVYLGGDGTFAEVAKGLLCASRSVPMGMLPSGTANNQGRSFGVSADPEALLANLEVIEAGNITHLDVGQVEKVDEHGEVLGRELFFDSIGWGFQADVLEQRNRDREVVGRIPLLRELYRDQAVYAGAALNRYLSSWVEPTVFDAEVETRGALHRYTRLTDLIINGTPVYAGDWVLDRRSEPDDGRMELVPVKGRRGLLTKAVLDFRRSPLWREHIDAIGAFHSDGYSADAFDVRLSRPGKYDIPCQIDGEEWLGGDSFKVRVLANRLPLLTPPEFVPPWRESG
jgi:diacylglycerol kinase family enzyme